MMIVQSPAQVTPAKIRWCSVLAVVRLNPVRPWAQTSFEGIAISPRDTRPNQEFQHVWPVFWLTVIGLNVPAFPGSSPVAIDLAPLPHTDAGTAPDLLPDGYGAPGSLLQPQPFGLWHPNRTL